MDKEEILKKSREENKGQDGEYEKSVYAEALDVSRVVSLVVCVVLAVCGRCISSPEVAFAAFIAFFSMQAGLEFTLFARLKQKAQLIKGIISTSAVIGLVVALVYLWTTSSL